MEVAEVLMASLKWCRKGKCPSVLVFELWRKIRGSQTFSCFEFFIKFHVALLSKLNLYHEKKAFCRKRRIRLKYLFGTLFIYCARWGTPWNTFTKAEIRQGTKQVMATLRHEMYFSQMQTLGNTKLFFRESVSRSDVQCGRYLRQLQVL